MDNRVLITGASQGIGQEFAKLFAADGHHLVLVARDEARLRQIANELTERHGIKVLALPKDLSKPNAAPEIFDELKREQVQVSMLVNNAGFGLQGKFAETELQRHLDLLQVNMAALVELTHLFLKPMLARRDGKILNVASTAAFMPCPGQAMYYASKAFVHSFSQALAEELAGSGVTVTTVYPGLTRSQFHARAGTNRPGEMLMMEADKVAKLGYRGLLKGKRMVVTGRMNKVFVCAGKLLPVGLMTRIVGKVNRART